MAAVDTVGRRVKSVLLPSLTIGTIWAMITAKDYTIMNSIKNYTNYFRENMRHMYFP
jgi:hypothetical protein